MAALVRVLHRNVIHGARSAVRVNTVPLRAMCPMRISLSATVRMKSDTNDIDDLDKIIKPIDVKPTTDPDAIDIGAELTGDTDLGKAELKKVLNQFAKKEVVLELAQNKGLENEFFLKAFLSFRFFCLNSKVLPADLHVIFSDIIRGEGNIVDLFPYFMRHAARVYPHIECIDSLRVISDLTNPAFWYPEARGLKRRIIFHAGPTNSGKTHHALERFREAKSGVYCGPLRLLASEVYRKTNAAGRACDLVTGEERHVVSPDDEPSPHVACTVEMSSVNTPYEVAVIDEIQMIRDPGRGWAWTRAFLGLCAEELHVCGEAAGVGIVQELAATTGDSVEIRTYDRLTPLTVLDTAVESFSNIQPGDCIVCFNKNDIFHCTRQLERRKIPVAVIYGALPAETKIAQAEKFNDPDDPCKVLVATDAIGMGLNLNIKRIIFFSLTKTVVAENGDKEKAMIPATQALQIAGRAGRYGTQWEHGHVTTFLQRELPALKEVLNTPVDSIERAGLYPTSDQIQRFAFQLPGQTLANLIGVFVHVCQMDNSTYFMCGVDVFKALADSIEHLPLPLPVRYTFCCAPVNTQHTFCLTMLVKYASKLSRGEMVTYEWLTEELGVPFEQPTMLAALVHLEDVYDSLDLYLWLSYRFPEMFPHPELVQEMQKELNEIIHEGVANINQLLLNSDSTPDGERQQPTIIRPRKKRQKKTTKYSMPADDVKIKHNGGTSLTALLKGAMKNGKRRGLLQKFDDVDRKEEKETQRLTYEEKDILTAYHEQKVTWSKYDKPAEDIEQEGRTSSFTSLLRGIGEQEAPKTSQSSKRGRKNRKKATQDNGNVSVHKAPTDFNSKHWQASDHQENNAATKPISVSNKGVSDRFSVDSEMPDPMELFQRANKQSPQSVNSPTVSGPEHSKILIGQNIDNQGSTSRNLHAEKDKFDVFQNMVESVGQFQQTKQTETHDSVEPMMKYSTSETKKEELGSNVAVRETKLEDVAKKEESGTSASVKSNLLDYLSTLKKKD